VRERAWAWARERVPARAPGRASVVCTSSSPESSGSDSVIAESPAGCAARAGATGNAGTEVSVAHARSAARATRLARWRSHFFRADRSRHRGARATGTGAGSASLRYGGAACGTCSGIAPTSTARQREARSAVPRHRGFARDSRLVATATASAVPPTRSPALLPRPTATAAATSASRRSSLARPRRRRATIPRRAAAVQCGHSPGTRLPLLARRPSVPAVSPRFALLAGGSRASRGSRARVCRALPSVTRLACVTRFPRPRPSARLARRTILRLGIVASSPRSLRGCPPWPEASRRDNASRPSPRSSRRSPRPSPRSSSRRSPGVRHGVRHGFVTAITPRSPGPPRRGSASVLHGAPVVGRRCGSARRGPPACAEPAEHLVEPAAVVHVRHRGGVPRPGRASAPVAGASGVMPLTTASCRCSFALFLDLLGGDRAVPVHDQLERRRQRLGAVRSRAAAARSRSWASRGAGFGTSSTLTLKRASMDVGRPGASRSGGRWRRRRAPARRSARCSPSSPPPARCAGCGAPWTRCRECGRCRGNAGRGCSRLRERRRAAGATAPSARSGDLAQLDRARS